MSEKVKSKLQKTDKKFTISVNDFQYLKKVELIKNSLNYYVQQIQGEYLKLISLSLGFKPEQDLTFGLDLNGDARELTVHVLTDKEKEQLASKS